MTLVAALVLGLVALAIAPGHAFYFDVTPKVAVLLAGTAVLLVLAARRPRLARAPRLFTALLVLNAMSLALSSQLSTNRWLALYGGSWRCFGALEQCAAMLFAWMVARQSSARAILWAVAIVSAPAAVFGTLGDAPSLVMWLSMSVCLSMALARMASRTLWRWVARAAAVASLVALIAVCGKNAPWRGAHKLLWRDTLSMAAHRPLAGYGPEVFLAEFPHFESTELAREAPDAMYESPRNAFLDALISQGVPGLLLLCGLCAAGLVSAWKRPEAWLAAALLAGMVGLQFAPFRVPTALLFFTSIALAVRPKATPEARPNANWEALRADAQSEAMRPDVESEAVRSEAMPEARPNASWETLRTDAQSEAMRPDVESDAVRSKATPEAVPNASWETLRADAQSEAMRPDVQSEAVRSEAMPEARRNANGETLRADVESEAVRSKATPEAVPNVSWETLRADAQSEAIRPDAKPEAVRSAPVLAAVAPFVVLALLYFALRVTLADRELVATRRLIDAHDLRGATAEYEVYGFWRWPGTSADVWYSRSWLEVARRSTDADERSQALDIAEEAGARAIGSAEEPYLAWYNLAQVAMARGAFDNARLDLKWAIAAHPKWYLPHRALAVEFLRQSRALEAQKELAAAEELDGGKARKGAREPY